MWIRLVLGLSYTCMALSSAYQNIALNKPTYQQHRYTAFPIQFTEASNAVDGLKSNLSVWGGGCVISELNQRIATWWVNLTEILSIHHIVIYHRTENEPWGQSNGYTSRVLGFSLYVSNTTNRSEGVLCFKDTNFTTSTVPAIFNMSCFTDGQYIIYYNERGINNPTGYSQYAFNDLCEVEVYGCPIPGYYGNNCSIPCPGHRCRYCDLETGTCRGGCNPGYQGHKCELECTDGFYGDGCLKECGHCADKTQCHHVTGKCLDGCEPGYKGDNCSQLCDIGTFGIRCKEVCGHCQDLNKCLQTNGTCLTGCIAGYQDHLCKTPCPDGFFGIGCVNICNSTCIGCNKVNGVCETGCFPGWTGNYCHQYCSAGYHGNNCSNVCGNCRHGEACHPVNGSCLSGCTSGYQVPICTQECHNNTYGSGCTEICGHCLDSKPCHNINGSCIDGCSPGFKGDKCVEICERGYFGVRCLQECSAFCKTSQDCHHVSGYCKDGCKNGWQGNDCLEVYKPVDPDAIQHSSFYSILGMFCISLVLNGVFIAYIVILRNRITKLDKPGKSSTEVHFGRNEKVGFETTVNSRYQELGDSGRNFTIYDTLE